MTDRIISIYGALEEVPPDFTGIAKVENANYEILIKAQNINGVITRSSDGSSSSIDYKPNSTSLGAGSWRVGSKLYLTNGTSYSLASDNKYPTLKWDAALAKLKVGTGNAKVLFLGDSTSCGAWANGTALLTGNLMRGWNRKLSALINTPTSNNNYIGTAGAESVLDGVPTAFLAYDTRVTVDADWGNGFASLGGGAIRNMTTSLTSIHFLPLTAFDMIDIYYITGASYGTITVDIGAGVLATQNTTGTANSVSKLSVPCTLGINTVNINKTTTGPVQILGISCYKNNNEIQLIAAGQASIVANNYITSGLPVRGNVVTAIAPNLSIIDLGINDSNTSIAITSFITSQQATINKCLETGDVALCVPNVINVANKDTYFDAIRNLAAKNNLNIIDFDKKMGSSWAASNTLGLMWDALHPLEVGYQLMADDFYNSGVIAK